MAESLALVAQIPTNVSVMRDNAKEIETYLEVLVPLFEPNGGVPDVPLSRKERGSSRAPLSDWVMDLWYQNIHAVRINSVIQDAVTHDGYVEIEGVPMWQVLTDCLLDHSAIRRWKNKGGAEERRFYKMCLLLAYLLAQKYDNRCENYEIHVYIRTQDQQQRQQTRDAQRITTFYTRSRMVEQLEEIEREIGERGVAAMRILSQRKQLEGENWSVPKLRKAREVVNRARAVGETMRVSN